MHLIYHVKRVVDISAHELVFSIASIFNLHFVFLALSINFIANLESFDKVGIPLTSKKVERVAIALVG